MLRDVLKALLLQKGLTQKEIASEIQVSENTVSRFFSHKSDMKCDEFIKVLKLAGIDLNKIISEKLIERAQEPTKLSIFEKLRARQTDRLAKWHSGSERV